MDTGDQRKENAPMAFVLVTCAGLSTAIGAAFVFNKRLVKLASKRFLAGSLGLAAGVMLYVSLVEIFVKSQIAFVNHGHSKEGAYTFATLSLFGGIFLYKGIDFVVHLLEGGPVGDHDVDIELYDLDSSSSTGGDNSPRAENAAPAKKERSKVLPVVAPSRGRESDLSEASSEVVKTSRPNANTTGGGNMCHRRDSFSHEHDVVVELSTGGTTLRPSPDLHTLRLRQAGTVQQQQHQRSHASALMPAEHSSGYKGRGGEDVMEEWDEGRGGLRSSEASARETENAEDLADTTVVAGGDDQKLVRMGLLTAVAIFIHNFPEGLATFVAALSDPSVGLALAVAIAIHNIPEGLCVAIPVYYATGNRWKALGWALLSGVSEPIGAGLGWLILKDIMSELGYGILFGVVAGMMVNITIHELIPTAVRYDPADKVTTNSLIAGMAMMALSLTLFLY